MSKRANGKYNERKLAASLHKRQQRARQLQPLNRRAADELWRVWEDASPIAILADEFWPAGRDAAGELIRDGRREEGQRRLRHVLCTLCAFDLHQRAAACLTHASDELADRELLEHLRALDAPSALVSLLPERVGLRALAAAKVDYADKPSEESARLYGRLRACMTSHDEGAPPGDPLEEGRDLEARALRFVRSQGADTVGGYRYEAQYALWRMLGEDGIESLSLQDLEDIRLVHPAPDGSRATEHVQVKKRSGDWSIPRLQGRDAGANKVFDSFAEVVLAEPGARLTFATDAKLARGGAPHLLSAATKFRSIIPDPARLDAAALAQVGLTAGERQALEQLRQRMSPALLDQIDLPSLLARVTFDTGRTRRELRSELIRRISARLGVADPAAEDAYHALLGLLLEQMEEREEFSRTDIDALLRQAGVKARAFRELTATASHVEVLDFAPIGGAMAEHYYQGLSTSPADIVAGFDALRPSMLAEIRRELANRRCCVIRGPSGQGKTTLLYRYAYESADDMPLVRVHRLDHAAVAELAHLIQSFGAAPLLVLIDDLASGDPQEWPKTLRRLVEWPQVHVLATSREVDWRLSAVSTLDDVVGFVYPKLDEHTAEVIFDGLAAIDGLRLHAEHWREPFVRADGLLMEYVHLLTQGRRMRDLVAEQIAGRERRLSHHGPTVLGALRVISTAHRYGGYVSRATLTKLLPASQGIGIGRTLRVLEEEFWIRDHTDHRYTGLHQERSRIVADILHEHDPIADTIEQLLREGDADEVGAMLEELLYRDPDACPEVLRVLAERAPADGPRFGLRVATAAYAVEERRYADEVFSVLDRWGQTKAVATLVTWATLPKSFHVADIIALLPSARQPAVRALLSAVPRRRYEQRMELQFLQALGREQVAAWLAREAHPQDVVDLLHLLAIVAPDFGRAALERAGIGVLARRCQHAPPSELPDLLSAVRDVDVRLAHQIADHLGTAFAVERALTTVDGCYAVLVDGEMVRAQFAAGSEDGEEPVNTTAVRITGMLYGLFPRATASEVSGHLDARTLHPAAEKRIPRDNMPPPAYLVALNRFWLSLAGERLAASSLATVLRLHDAHARTLLTAFDAAHCYLEQPSHRNQRSTLDAWSEVRTAGAAIPYGPHQTDPLITATTGRAAQAGLPGSQPVDQIFEKISGAANNIAREFGRYLVGDRHNQAILDDQLATLQREALAYRDLRISLGLLDAEDDRLHLRLSRRAARLRQALDVVSPANRQRPHRGEAQRLYDAVSVLRTLALDLFAEVQRAPEWATGVPGAGAKVSILTDMLAALREQAPGWEPLAVLERALDLLMRVTSHASLPEPDIRETTRTAVDSLVSDLHPLTPLDAEAWLVTRATSAELARLEGVVRTELATHEITATCRVLPPSLEAPLAGAAIVVVQPGDLRRLQDIRAGVRDIAFAVLPHTVSRLALLLRGREGAVLPLAFQTWRFSDVVSNPYRALLGLELWQPELEVELLARHLGVAVERRTHLVAQHVDAVREQLARLVLSYGHLAAMAAAASSLAWRVALDALVRQIDDVSADVQVLVERVNELTATLEEHPDWTRVASLIVNAVGSYLNDLFGVGDHARRDTADVTSGQWAETWTSSDNKLYLDREIEAERAVPLDESVARFQSACDAFVALRHNLLAELSDARNDEDGPDVDAFDAASLA